MQTLAIRSVNIDNSMQSLQQVMNKSEDLLQLVLGMTSSNLFREVFSEAHRHSEDLNQWFDRKTAKFGGQDAIAAVNQIVGSCDKFDFQQASPLLPQLDLQDLQPFFLTVLNLNKRRVTQTEDGLAFITPDAWRTEPAIQRDYEQVHFDRNRRNKNGENHLLGVGHKLLDAALSQAANFSACVTESPNLNQILFVFQITDRVTSRSTQVMRSLAAVGIDCSEKMTILKDWELLEKLNQSMRDLKKNPDQHFESSSTKICQLLNTSKQFLEEHLDTLSLPFKIPSVQSLSVLIPGKVI